MSNPLGPHQSVVLITIKAEIMERLPDGKVTGIPVERQVDSLIFTAKGNSKEECSEKTKELINKLKKRMVDGQQKKEEDE